MLENVKLSYLLTNTVHNILKFTLTLTSYNFNIVSLSLPYKVCIDVNF